MFNIFGKKRQIKKEDYTFLSIITENLSEIYPYLEEQVNRDFILDKKSNPNEGEGVFSLILNAGLENDFRKKDLPRFFIIKNVLVWNNIKNKYQSIELDIVEGMLSGFKIPAKYSNLDFNKIDISKVTEKHFENKDLDTIKELIGEVPVEFRYILDLEKSFKIELPEGDFYAIKDLGNGNYISINKKGAIYGMIHDPYEIEKLFENKDLFYKAIESGRFSFDEYFDEKMS